MIFLDTCVWVELLGVSTPIKPHEIKRAITVSRLLEAAIQNREMIVTCKEQIVELISAIEKVTMRTVNKVRKDNKLSGVSSVKEFRTLQEFQNTKELCKTVIDDLRHIAVLIDIGEYNIDAILRRLDLADLNDCIYYDYCSRENIEFYTLDSDFGVLGTECRLHEYNVLSDGWS